MSRPAQTPRSDGPREGGPPLLEVSDLVAHFDSPAGGALLRGRSRVRILDGVSFAIAASETLGLVGESGCGKSTLCRTVLQLLKPTSGSVRFDGVEIAGAGGRRLRPLRRRMQMVFQDPSSSLNPRKRIGQIVGEPLRLHGLAGRYELARRVDELLERVGLDRSHRDRYPHELSGGQRQRVGIARAIGPRPSLIVADEPLSALDTSIQAQIVNLLADLRDEMGLAYLFVSHDLALVHQIADRIAVMQRGRLVEVGPAAHLCARPSHPHTAELLSSVLAPDPRRSPIRRAEPGKRG